MTRLSQENSLLFIHAFGLLVLTSAVDQSLQTVFDTSAGTITPRLYSSYLHFLLLANLVIDWSSAIIRNQEDNGLTPTTIFSVLLLLFIESYIAVLAFDPSSILPIAAFVVVTAFAVPYDIYRYAQTCNLLYVASFIGRAMFLVMALVAGACYFLTKDRSDIIVILTALTIAKVLRWLFLLVYTRQDRKAHAVGNPA
jgi:hypothetical protein